MSAIISIVTSVVWFLLIASVIAGFLRTYFRSVGTGTKRVKAYKPSNPAAEQEKDGYGEMHKRLRLPAIPRKGHESYISMEDREGDWLARQLAEEKRALLKNDFLDLGAAHDARCAAGELKRSHMHDSV